VGRTSAERIEDVKRLQAAARALVGRRDVLVPELVASTGLSPANVELALTRHLEVEASERDLAQLVAHAGDAPCVAVVLSANVFVGALRAIALARAASERVVVRPSRREPAFARALVEAARELGDLALHIVDELDVASIDEGEIHVYGRDETIASVRARARVRVRGHGSGMGVAWISSGADVAAAVSALASDVVVFDQRGCLSPRIALVQGDESRALAVAEALHRELERAAQRVPRGAMPPEERADASRYIATMTYAGSVLTGREHAVAVAPPGAPLVLPPPYRHVHVAPRATEEDAALALTPLAKGIVSFGSDELEAARRIAPRSARVSLLGAMQRPPLDGPVDLRTD